MGCEDYGHQWELIRRRRDPSGTLKETLECLRCRTTKIVIDGGDGGISYARPRPMPPPEPTPEERSQMRSELEEQLRQLRA